MAGDYWNPNYWTAGTFYPENGAAQDRLTVAVAAPLSDVGRQTEADGAHPRLMESNSVGKDELRATGFAGLPVSGAGNWEDRGVNHLEVHFTTAAARNAYASALADAVNPAAVEAVVKNYRDHAVGGFWGTVEVAL